jgi:hypothetical protein
LPRPAHSGNTLAGAKARRETAWPASASFGTLKLDAELLDTPTAKAIVAALSTSAVLTWGEESF